MPMVLGSASFVGKCMAAKFTDGYVAKVALSRSFHFDSGDSVFSRD